MSTIANYVEEYLVSASVSARSQQSKVKNRKRYVRRSLAVAFPVIGSFMVAKALWPQGDSFVEPVAFDMVSTGQIERTEDLINRTPSLLSQTDLDGNTLLYSAVLNARPRIVELLLSKGADPNAPNQAGDLPLTAALVASHHAWPMAKMLLEHGAVVGKTLPNGDNALHLAARFRQYDRHVMVMMARDHAALHARDQHGLNPQQIAQREGSFELARLLAEVN